MEDCIIHSQDVKRGAPNTFCIGHMPFGSYQVSNEKSVENTVRFLRKADRDAINLDGGKKAASKIKSNK